MKILFTFAIVLFSVNLFSQDLMSKCSCPDEKTAGLVIIIDNVEVIDKDLFTFRVVAKQNDVEYEKYFHNKMYIKPEVMKYIRIDTTWKKVEKLYDTVFMH